ncbi:hypothetical protein WMY93_019647 [Mugilogobius chulae]|uniref:Uncharacterized protein n=1 Tax=Mugilogobius chulae TaxID=88201 RepID=A0AAW0NKJ6_9GOBI
MESRTQLLTHETRRKRRRLTQTDTDGALCSDATEYCTPSKRMRLQVSSEHICPDTTVDTTRRDRKRSIMEVLGDSSKYWPPRKRIRVQMNTEDVQMDTEVCLSDSDQMETDDSSNVHSSDDCVQMEIDAEDEFVPMETDDNTPTGSLLDPVPMETDDNTPTGSLLDPVPMETDENTPTSSLLDPVPMETDENRPMGSLLDPVPMETNSWDADAPDTEMETDSAYIRSKLLTNKVNVSRKANAKITKMETDSAYIR